MFNFFKPKSIDKILESEIRHAQGRMLSAQHNLSHYTAQVDGEQRALEKLHQQLEAFKATGRLDGGMPPSSFADSLSPRKARRSRSVPGASPNMGELLATGNRPGPV